jgi:cytochrome oxidase Cu insertion factor (SCO1/SenC/PrrC family)
MNNPTINLLLLSFYSAPTDPLIIEQTVALIHQLDIKATVFNGRVVFIMSDVSRAIQHHPKQFAKNLAWTGKAKDMAGFYQLLRGKSLKQFKSAYQTQHKTTAAPFNSVYVGDAEMVHSYLSMSLPHSSLNYDALYERMDAIAPGEPPF